MSTACTPRSTKQRLRELFGTRVSIAGLPVVTVDQVKAAWPTADGHYATAQPPPDAPA